MKHLTRTEEEKQQLAQEIVESLNDMTLADPDVLHRLVETRFTCNEALLDHPTAQVLMDPGQAPTVGLLGILNGLVGVGSDGWGYIAAQYNDDGKFLGFIRTSDPSVKKLAITIDETQ